MSFLKRLFGAAPAAPPPAAAAPAPPDPRAEVQKARDAARVIRRQRDPVDWAAAQQLLANALIQLAAVQTGGSAVSTFEEAEACLYDALDAAGPDADPGFRASMTNLWGYVAFRRADRLQGDAKGQALADAANRFTEAFHGLDPETHRDLWLTVGFYRGAVFHELAELQKGAQSLGWYDEAAAAFKIMEERGAADGARHPIAAFNRYVVLEARGRMTGGATTLGYLNAAREALVFAMTAPNFAAHRPDHEARLAALDAEIAKIRG